MLAECAVVLSGDFEVEVRICCAPRLRIIESLSTFCKLSKRVLNSEFSVDSSKSIVEWSH